MTSLLAICPDPSASEQPLEAVDDTFATTAVAITADVNEDDEADWYDDGAIGGGGSGLADAPQGW
ncbi:MAG: hypothetical protein ACKO2F_04940 [Cyanobacteriota bacterium]